jgi:phosphatidylglycerol:prolipoprotein diacylglycerol transferase
LFREPDVQIGYIFGFLSMGQILSLAMIALGMFLKLLYLPSHTGKQVPRAQKDHR